MVVNTAANHIANIMMLVFGNGIDNGMNLSGFRWEQWKRQLLQL